MKNIKGAVLAIILIPICLGMFVCTLVSKPKVDNICKTPKAVIRVSQVNYTHR